MELIVEYLGRLVLFGGGATAIAFGLFRWFGQKWINQTFSKEMETFKRKQEAILEEVRYEINTRFNRATKIHEKEFDVLPTAWTKLQESYGYLISLAAPFQEYPDLNNYSKEELNAFLDKVELFEHQKEELKLSTNPLLYYQEKSYWIKLDSARRKLSDFRMYLRYNKIFLTKELFLIFSEIDETLISAEIELSVRSVEESHHEHLRRNNLTWKEVRTKIDPLMEKLEQKVQERLHFQ